MTNRSKTIETGAVVGVFSLLAISATYPLILEMTTHIAGDLGDPLLVAWMLGWDADRMRHGLAGVWNAPNFFPYTHTLLYSEHFLGVALFTAPLQWMTHNPIFVYNLAFLGSFIVSGGGMYVLARSLTGRRDAAFVAAVIFALQPFRASHSSHLQLLIAGWLPLSIWAFHRYFHTRRLRDLLASTLFFLLQALTSGYFAYFALVPLIIVAGYELWRTRWFSLRLVVHLAAAAALAVVVMLPVTRAYWALRRESGLRRPIDEITSQSADAADYVSASPSLYLWGGLGRGRGEHELFPGVTAVALAVLSLRLRPRPATIGLYGVVLVTAVVLSLGPAPRVLGHSLGVAGPYALLLRTTPGLDGIRVPARLAVVAQVALAILAAFGAMWLLDRFAPRSRSLAVAIATLTLVVSAEGWARLGHPAFDYRGDPIDRQAYAYLESLPKGAAIELPTAAEQLLREFTYQYMTLVHRHPIVNGHSGYVTPLAFWLRGGHSPLREEGRQSDAVAMLRSIGVRYLVVHRSAYVDQALGDELLQVIRQEPQVLAHRTFDDATVAVLAPPEGQTPMRGLGRVSPGAISARASDAQERLPFLFDGDPDSRWLSGRPQSGDEWLTLQLDRPRDIRLVRLQLGTRSFGDYPRDLVIDAIEETGVRRLFHGSVLPQLARGILADGDYPFIDIALPSNGTKALTLRQLGKTHTFFWSIHELQLFERGSSG